MGGYGSGRWGFHVRKSTVEECLTLDLATLGRAGFLYCFPGKRVRGTLRWINVETKEEAASVNCILDTTSGVPVLTLAYRVRGENINLPIHTEVTRSYRDRVRRWGICPDCGRRVRKLHLPPGGRRFSCRTCLGLSYTSVQHAHELDGLPRFIARVMGLP